VVLEKKLSLEEYFTLEQTLELRHEFVDGELIEMPGTTLQHNDIVQNFVLALTRVARAKGCQLTCESIKLQVGNNRIRYPDVMLSCHPKESNYLETAPCFLVEVLSDSTETTDGIIKAREYTSLPSLEMYAIVAQTERLVVLYERREQEWIYRSLTEGSFAVPCLETTLSLDAIYEGIVLEPQTGGLTR
jgi:Uma2 family endonuclease